MLLKEGSQVFTYTDKAARDAEFQALRTSPEPNERQVTKFSGVQEDPEYLGNYISNFSLAYPFEVGPQNHGSLRNPKPKRERKSA